MLVESGLNKNTNLKLLPTTSKGTEMAQISSKQRTPPKGLEVPRVL